MPVESEKPDNSLPHPVFDWRPFIFTLLTFFLYYSLVADSTGKVEAVSYSAFKELVKQERIQSVVLTGKQVDATGISADQSRPPRYVLTLPDLSDDGLLPLLEAHGVELKAESQELPFWLSLMINILPWLIIFGFFAYSNRMIASRMGGKEGPFSFSRSKAKRFTQVNPDIGFDQVAGHEAAKADLQEVIDFLTSPRKYRALGAKLPRGMLMMGPPGTGKTLLAKATAAEAGVPFFSVSGSEFVEMFVGVGASRVRDMFAEARKLAPALIFIDEIDSIGRVRGTGMGGGNDEREQTLNQILAEMDGFSSDEAVVVLAATNRPDVLDPALLRPGRFDRKVVLELPQKLARVQILQVHIRDKPLSSEIDLEQFAARTIGFSGADLENLVNEAALHAARLGRSEISLEDFEYAHDKVLLGEVRQEIQNAQERRRIALHESGHALVAMHSAQADPVAKITIIPRGRALGVTETMAREDRLNFSQDYLFERLVVLLGGRCAEKLVLGSVSSGAADDLKQCSRLARQMVAQWGMSDELGPMHYPVHEEHPFLGMELTQPKDYSDLTGRRIDEAVEKLVKKAQSRAADILASNREDLEVLASALMERETLDVAEINELLGAQET